jgi:hypothetical protein
MEFRMRSARFTGWSTSGKGRMNPGLSLSQAVRVDTSWLMQNSFSAASSVRTLGLPRPVKGAERRASGEALGLPPESRSISPISRRAATTDFSAQETGVVGTGLSVCGS